MRYLDILIAVGIAFLSVAIIASGAAESQGKIVTINETNWRDLLTGEWLVKLWVTFASYIMIFKNIHTDIFILIFLEKCHRYATIISRLVYDTSNRPKVYDPYYRSYVNVNIRGGGAFSV